jgi:hypothetical protein
METAPALLIRHLLQLRIHNLTLLKQSKKRMQQFHNRRRDLASGGGNSGAAVTCLLVKRQSPGGGRVRDLLVMLPCPRLRLIGYLRSEEAVVGLVVGLHYLHSNSISALMKIYVLVRLQMQG